MVSIPSLPKQAHIKELIKLAPARRKVRMVVTLRVTGKQPLLEGVTTKLGRRLVPNEKGELVTAEMLAAPLKPVPGKSAMGGLLLPPESGSKEVKLVTWNTGDLDPKVESNATHAERQFVEWFEDQPLEWRNRVETIDIRINFSPCTFCAVDLRRIVALAPSLKSASITYDKKYTQGPLATTEASLGQLRRKWTINGQPPTGEKEEELVTKE